ncbi:MAG: hypothetical protein GY804_00045 [Alphaproteobacteria bacterium]|nr:hypothetical protein [Alphaproteobacteria bacterium]
MANRGIVDTDDDGDLYDEFRERIGEDQTVHAELGRPHIAPKSKRERYFVHCSEFHLIK